MAHERVDPVPVRIGVGGEETPVRVLGEYSVQFRVCHGLDFDAQAFDGVGDGSVLLHHIVLRASLLGPGDQVVIVQNTGRREETAPAENQQ